MVNFNGTLVENTSISEVINNRGFKYGDALFETIKVVDGKVFFWEDHYFRLMASMRILRMEIPMNFTMEFLENEILNVIDSNSEKSQAYKVRLYVNRIGEGLYTPMSNHIGYVITSEVLENHEYTTDIDQTYVVDLYKDHYIAPGLLSTLKTNNKVLQVLASIYAQENKLDNCLLLNTSKQVVETTNGNIFLVSGSTIKTPPLLDGCLKGIMRKQIIELIKTTLFDYELIEDSISPFELQKADELFTTNIVKGIQPITQYRKKVYKKDISKKILEALNTKLN